jgi:hypothetical protein
MPGSLGRGPAPDAVPRVSPAASPAFVYSSPEQRRGRFRTMAEDNLSNLDAARPLAPRMIEVDLIVAQQVMDASTDTGRKKEIRNDVVGWLIQASDERCGLFLETLNETDRETSVFFTGLATILGGLGAIFTPASTVRTPLDIIRERMREAVALRFQRECVAAANADPASARCRALKAEANGTGGS